MNAKDLKKIQAKDLPFLRWTEIFTAEGEVTDEHKKAMKEYFAKFVKSEGCPNCGEQYGHVRYNLAHGEAHCTTEDCGWPYRGNHYDVGPIKALKLMLPYHPDALSFDDVTEEDS